MAKLLPTLAVLLFVVAPLAAQDAPLLAGRHVVAITGLPGDVESEAAYERDLKRLLEILSLPGARPRKLTVLTDAGSVELPAGLEADVGTASRENVLALKGELNDATVFVWGHGGRLRDEAVFHVRGPRLTAGDLAGLATAADEVAASSRWLLFFPQSGAFARALRGPGCQVLASEDRVAFKSDPIGLSLLLDVLRAEPGLTLADAAQRFGPRLVDWYEEHHLARQEDPYLWIGEADGVHLAALAAAEDEDEGGAEEVEDVEDVVASATWDALELADPADYPGENAVVLEQSTSYVLAENPAMTQETEQLIQILTGDGTKHGDFDVMYSPPDEKLTFVDLEVRRPDGTVVRMDPQSIGDLTPTALPGYRAPTRKRFSMPQVTAGAVLRIHTRREWKRFPLPYIPLEIPVAGSLPVRGSTVEVRVDNERPFHWTLPRMHVQPAIDEKPYSHVYRWTFEDLEPSPDEVLTAPGSAPALLVSTFPSWQEYLGWYQRLIQQADELTPEIEAKARELTAGIPDQRAQVEALYNWVTGLRYVAIPLGVNSHRPHAARNVFENRYGDCKDKANLFNTMLRAIGVDADLVLVPRFSQAYDATPGLGFNHAISRVRLGDEVIWADTTDDTARFGLLPPGDPGRRVLVIADGVDGLTPLPEVRPEEHRLTLRSVIDLSKNTDEGVPVKMNAATAGFPDYVLRSAGRAIAGRARTRPLPFTVLRPVHGVFAMTDQGFTPPAALEKAFEWRGTGRWTGVVTARGEDTIVRLPFLLPEEWDAALHERTSPLYLNRGYPLTLEQEIVLTGAAGDLPAEQSGEADALRWRLTWEAADGRKIARLRVVLPRGEMDEALSRSFQSELRRLHGALGPRSDLWLGKAMN